MASVDWNEAVLAAALDAFANRGYAATSMADILGAPGDGEHIDAAAPSKEDLLTALVEPFLNELDWTLDTFPRHPSWPDEGRRMLSAYLDVLLRHRKLVGWIDGDTAVLLHPTLGKRMADNNRRVRDAVRGDRRSAGARLGASAVLGALWRPLRNMADIDASHEAESMLAAAMAVAEAVRAS